MNQLLPSVANPTMFRLLEACALSELRRKTTHDGSMLKRMNKPKRNSPCPCGSGVKWKKCCGINNPNLE